MNPTAKSILNNLSSLKLSVVLIGFALALVFFGTLDQVQYGIRETQARYFESFIVYWSYPEIWPGAKYLSWFPLPLPGGYLLGPLIVLNMGASLIKLFRFKFKLLGVAMIHVGILLLFIGQFVTQISQEEYYLWLDEGESKNYIQHFHQDEVVIIKKVNGKKSIHSTLTKNLEKGSQLNTSDRFGFTAEVLHYYPNTAIQPSNDEQFTPLATHGIAVDYNLDARPVPVTYADNERNAPTAIIKISNGEREIGRWMVSTLFQDRFQAQEFLYNGAVYEIAMQPHQEYLDFTIELEKFNHDKYPGTEIPYNFSSEIELFDHKTKEERKITISMNQPLRYGGKTFYQASFAKQDTASMFQVVENPGWLIPYISCTLVSIGMLFQFLYSGIRYSKRKK